MAATIRPVGFTRLIAICVVLVAFLALPLALPAAAHAGTSYYVSVVGSDSVGTGSLAAPFATVQRAVNVAGANGGGVVSVGIGVFSGDVTMTAGDAGVSLEGAGASLTTLRGDGLNSVIRLDNMGGGATISGFTITGGNADVGGGIYCAYSSPTITGNTISGNTANARIWDSGGGIYCAYSSPTITGNTITGNSAYVGGGIYCAYSSPTITGNTVTGNGAFDGGGINVGLCTGPVITDNTISNNSGYNGGGVRCVSSPSAKITRNTITGNSGTMGGGIYCNDLASINDDAIISNISTGTGGGIYLEGAFANIANSVLAGNRASGGGGGIYSHYSTPTITNDTITGNGGGPGGGINCDAHSSPAITNCIVWHNTSDLAGCSATYSDISTPAVGSNINAGPDFLAALGGDFHLSAGSPCIDEASPTAAPATDKDGISRPWGAGYDTGAYEYYVATFHTTTSLTGPTSSKVNKTLTLSGAVSPTAQSPYAPPGTVMIVKTHKVGKSWKSAGSAKVGVVGGKFTYSFKPTAKGSWHVTATYSGGVIGPTTYLPSASGAKGVTVK